MKWTFYDLEIFIHHTCSPTPFDRCHAPSYPERRDALIAAGLLRVDEEGVIRATEMGDAFGNMLKSTPLPVRRYIDPRFDALEE